MVWTFVKNMPGPLLWLYLPQHLALNLAALAYYPFRRQGRAIIKAKIDALRGLPEALRQRRPVQRSCSGESVVAASRDAPRTDGAVSFPLLVSRKLTADTSTVKNCSGNPLGVRQSMCRRDFEKNYTNTNQPCNSFCAKRRVRAVYHSDAVAIDSGFNMGKRALISGITGQDGVLSFGAAPQQRLRGLRDRPARKHHELLAHRASARPDPLEACRSARPALADSRHRRRASARVLQPRRDVVRAGVVGSADADG